jgi:predicted nucleic acid-binding protein
VIVVADTSSLNYLVLLKRVEVLPAIYGQVIIPHAVLEEMRAEGAPPVVRLWAERLPEWINVVSALRIDVTLPAKLGDGEKEAISLALEIAANIILMDDQPGRVAAEARGLIVSGTLSVLMRASRRGLLDFEATLLELKVLGFRISDDVEARVRRTE